MYEAGNVDSNLSALMAVSVRFHAGWGGGEEMFGSCHFHKGQHLVETIMVVDGTEVSVAPFEEIMEIFF